MNNDSSPPSFAHWQQPPFIPSSSTAAPPPFHLFSPPPLFFAPNLPPTPIPQTPYQHAAFSPGVPSQQSTQNGFYVPPGQEWQSRADELGPTAGVQNASGGSYNFSLDPSITPWPGYRRVRSSALTNPDLTTNVYVRLLPPETRDLDLYHLGLRFGAVLSVRALVNEVTAPGVFDEYGVEVLPAEKKRGGCKGVGFILFTKIEDAEQAILGLNGMGFEASFAKDSVSMKLRRLADAGSTNLYLSNLPPSYEEQDLVNLFSPLHVKSVRLLRDSDDRVIDGQRAVGPSRGIGFARLEDRAATDEAIAKLQNLRLPGSSLPLKIRYADSTEQKELKTNFGRGPAKVPRAFITPPSTPSSSTYAMSISPHTSRTSQFSISPTKPPPPFFAPGRISPPTALSSRAEPPFPHPFPHHLHPHEHLSNPFIQHPSARHFTSSSLLSPPPDIRCDPMDSIPQTSFQFPSNAFQPLSNGSTFQPLSNETTFRFPSDGGASAFRFPDAGGVGEEFRREAFRFPSDGNIRVGVSRMSFGEDSEAMEVDDGIGRSVRGSEGRKSLP